MSVYQIVYDEIVQKYLQKLEYVGAKIEGEIAERILQHKIYDTREFYNKLTHNVSKQTNSLSLRIWSTAPHSKFVLGGKVPSWTPIKPLEAWVQRKGLNWMDKKGNRMSVSQMAYIIQRKIKREGIKERNVFIEIIKENKTWIKQTLGAV